MICNKCKRHCMCADCVKNPFYAVNTPNPCIGADCDICNHDMEVMACNHHLTLEELNKRVEEMKINSLTE